MECKSSYFILNYNFNLHYFLLKAFVFYALLCFRLASNFF